MCCGIHIRDGVDLRARQVQRGRPGHVYGLCSGSVREQQRSDDNGLHGAVSRGAVWVYDGYVVGVMQRCVHRGVLLCGGVDVADGSDMQRGSVQLVWCQRVRGVSGGRVRWGGGADQRDVQWELYRGVLLRGAVHDSDGGSVWGGTVQLVGCGCVCGLSSGSVREHDGSDDGGVHVGMCGGSVWCHSCNVICQL
jgi:hypothetical protein